jgi:hypothetical protein
MLIPSRLLGRCHLWPRCAPEIAASANGHERCGGEDEVIGLLAELARHRGRSGSQFVFCGRARSAPTRDGSVALHGKRTGVGVWPNVF